MADGQLTRRQWIGAMGGTLSGTLAGCSSFLNSGSQTPGRSDKRTTQTSPNTTVPEDANAYTRVYHDTIGSIVRVSVTGRSGEDGVGSGFVYRDNHLITNAHVVANAQNVMVRFSKGEWRTTSPAGIDPSSDLAVLSVGNRPQYATPLGLAEQQPEIGTRVVAIGNPYGLEGSMTDGLISGVNRSTPAPNGATIPDAIQTSAPVNPGNSGGPLMTLDNRVIGVVNAGGGENLAFAISAALVKLVVPDLIEKGEYIHPYVGIVPVTVTPELAGRIGLDEPQGVYVESIIPDSPAAGVLESGDVIVAIGETQVTTRQQFISYLALHTSPGVSVQITVKRGGSSQTTSFTVGERPEQSESVT